MDQDGQRYHWLQSSFKAGLLFVILPLYLLTLLDLLHCHCCHYYHLNLPIWLWYLPDLQRGWIGLNFYIWHEKYQISVTTKNIHISEIFHLFCQSPPSWLAMVMVAMIGCIWVTKLPNCTISPVKISLALLGFPWNNIRINQSVHFGFPLWCVTWSAQSELVDVSAIGAAQVLEIQLGSFQHNLCMFLGQYLRLEKCQKILNVYYDRLCEKPIKKP